MTVKHWIVGSLLGAGAVATAVMLHRMPQTEVDPAVKLALQQPERSSHVNRSSHRKHSTDERMSSSKVFG